MSSPNNSKFHRRTGPLNSFQSYLLIFEQEMSGRTLEDQKMQKLLNYEIKMIEGCNDSLFTEADCQHQRYLSWGLCQNLKNLLKKYCYTIRWIGNDPHSYVHAYFYAVIMGCAANPDFMVELKTVLYDLAQKYLAIFQQKLLVQFLCLIGYCQERYIFFRKYSKIEEILLKIFKQIQERNSYQLQVELEPLASHQSSASKSYHERVITQSKSQNDINLVSSTSNSNTAALTNEQKQQRNDKGMWKSKQDYSFVKWYEIYNQYFSFLCMDYLTEENIQLSIDLPKRGIHDIDSFVVTVEKGCFFIVELMLIRKVTEPNKKEDRAFNVEATKAYRDGLLEKEIQESRVKRDVIFPNQTQKLLKQEISPKFFVNRKKNFGETSLQNAQTKDFNYDYQKTKQMREVIPEQTPSSETSIVPLKNNTADLYPVKNIVDLSKPQRNALRQQVKSHPLYEEYKKQTRFNSKDEKPQPLQKKPSRFAQFIQKTRQPQNVLKQNKSMDSSSHRVIDNLKKINPPNLNHTHNAINTQDSIVQRANLHADKNESKLRTGLTLPTETNLPVLPKPNGPGWRGFTFSNVKTVFSPDRRLTSTSPTIKIPNKTSVNIIEHHVMKLGAGHKTQISFG